MQVIFERCAAVDVGKDVIAVAVQLPGDGPDGRVSIKRTFKTFYGVLAEAARWLTSLDVTHVAMEATGIYSMPVFHALLGHGRFEKVLVCSAGHVKNVPGRKTDLLTELPDVSAVQEAWASLRPMVGLSPKIPIPGRGSHDADLIATESGHTVLNCPPSSSSLPILHVSRGGQ